MNRLLILLLVVCFAIACVPGAAFATPASPAQETAEEAVEEGEEAAEEAAAPMSFAATPVQARDQGHIEHLKEMIAKYRASLKFTRTLPHTTTRWLLHRPNKRLKIKACRTQIRYLRSLAS